MSKLVCFYPIFFLLIFLGSSSAYCQQSFLLKGDTIIARYNLCDTSHHLDFYNIKNVLISSDYEIIDSVSLHINNDKFPDLVLILEPQVDPEYKIDSGGQYIRDGDCRSYDTNGNKLLVVLLSQGAGKYKIGLINQHAIEKDQSVFYYKGKMKNVRNGFYTNYSWGSVNRCEYSFYFKVIDGEIYLVSNEYGCYNEHIYNPKNGTKHYKINVKTLDIEKVFSSGAGLQ